MSDFPGSHKCSTLTPKRENLKRSITLQEIEKDIKELIFKICSSPQVVSQGNSIKTLRKG